MRRTFDLVLLPLFVIACGGTSLRSEQEGGGAGENASGGTLGGTRSGTGGTGNVNTNGGFGAVAMGGSGGTGGTSRGGVGGIGTAGSGAYGGQGAFGGASGGGPIGGAAGTLSGHGGDAGSGGSSAGGGVGGSSAGAGAGGSGGKTNFTSDPDCPRQRPTEDDACEPIAGLCSYESYNDCLCTSFDSVRCFSWVVGCWMDEAEAGGGAAGTDGAGGADTAQDVSTGAQAPPPGATRCSCIDSKWTCVGL